MLPELVKAKVKKIKSDEDITIVTDEQYDQMDYTAGHRILHSYIVLNPFIRQKHWVQSWIFKSFSGEPSQICLEVSHSYC